MLLSITTSSPRCPIDEGLIQMLVRKSGTVYQMQVGDLKNHFFIFMFSFCNFNFPFKCQDDIINVSGLLYVPGVLVHLDCSTEIP